MSQKNFLTEMVWGNNGILGQRLLELCCISSQLLSLGTTSFKITIANQNSVLKSVIFLIILPERSKLTAQGIVLDSRNYSSKKYRGKLRTKNLWLFVLFAH